MPGQRELLNVCFSCLRYSRMASGGLPLVRPVSASNAFLMGTTQCGRCQHTTTGHDSGEAKKKTTSFEIEDNPFYKKYKDKLQYLADSDPDQFKFRLEQLQEVKKPKPAKPTPAQSSGTAIAGGAGPTPTPQPVPQSASYTTAKGLDSVMKLDLVQDKSPEEIEQIWKEYHSKKDCVFAVLKKEDFEDLMSKAQQCPTFVFPLPRNDGFEFMLMQFDGKDVQFTSLAMYQILKENAPACMSLTHYTELVDSKGIVLMSGQYDDKVLKREEALMVVQLMTIYYGKNTPRFDRVYEFNHKPDSFDYNVLIDDCKNLYANKAE
ncbi:hypothetical protein BaRGS_00004817 [Batillaria attramentaria]|uniref:ATP synthase mitochondrial F1 complex assembly factor 1 n=1 Tax=Batillaria attramentaria TaxID=370345 RepID=A0ABD0LX22_9CAEN